MQPTGIWDKEVVYHLLMKYFFNIACNSACNYGSGRCISYYPVVCCPYFGLDNMCTTSCPTNYVASANTNFTCGK